MMSRNATLKQIGYNNSRRQHSASIPVGQEQESEATVATDSPKPDRLEKDRKTNRHLSGLGESVFAVVGTRYGRLVLCVPAVVPVTVDFLSA